MCRVKPSLAVLAVLLLCVPLRGQGTWEDEEALRAATQSLCHARVAMIGESATHGDGHTLAFKTALVERLVDRCGFDGVFFEANHDEFIHLNRRLRSGQTVTTADLLSAVGGLWSFYREFQPLAPFLLARAQTGRVFLGGIDDQLGQFGQDYANVAMISELTGLLAEPERERCSSALHKRIYFDYTQAAPYSQAGRSQIVTCLAEIQAAADADKTIGGADREDRLEMISATRRWVDRDLSSQAESIVNRDRSMFQNFEWLQGRLPKRHKVIVWAATVHIAKRGDPTWGDHAGTNFGSFVHRRYRKRAFSLGFSALAGSYRTGRKNFPAMPVPPSDSVEVHVLRDGGMSAGYAGAAQLVALGTTSGAFFRHSWQTLSWAEFLDGVVVFRSEYPPGDPRDK